MDTKQFFLLLVLLVAGIGGLFLFQQSQFTEIQNAQEEYEKDANRWSTELGGYFQEFTKFTRDSIEGAEQRAQAVQLQLAELQKANEDGTLKEKEEKAKEEAEEVKDEANEEEAEDEPIENPTEEDQQAEQDLTDLSNLTPQDVLQNPEKWRQKADEIRRRYLEHRLRAKTLTQEIKVLENEIIELNKIDPQTEEIKKEIEEKQKLLEQKKKEKKKVERRMRREKRTLDILKALFRIGAMIAMAAGQPQVAMVLMGVAQAIDGIGTEDSEAKGGEGGGYPDPPLPPGSGGGGGSGPILPSVIDPPVVTPPVVKPPGGPVIPPIVERPQGKTSATLCPAKGGGKVYVRVWSDKKLVQYTQGDAANENGWTDWMTLSPSDFSQVFKIENNQIKTELQTVYLTDKKVDFKSAAGKIMTYDNKATDGKITEYTGGN